MRHIDDETLALSALGESVLDAEQRSHLDECDVCARTVAELRRVVDSARAHDDPELVAPAPQVWSRVHAELGLADVVELAPRRERRAWLPVLLAACLALVLGIAGGILWERRSVEPTETTIASAALEPLPSWPGTSGEAVVQETADGRRQVVISVDAPAPEGTYREVWLLRPDVSGLVSLGVLEGSEGRFDVPDGLDLAAYPVVDVSEEHFDGDPAHSGDSVVRGSLDV